MADENAEAFDVYTDQFTITITPFGANLSFSVAEPHPSPGRAPQTKNLGTVRMSVEHLKTMVMIIRRQIIMVENQTGVKAEVPRNMLNQFQISPDDWDTFWQQPKDL